jgi:uncharacterized membrane protein YhiD involved in acid resistance
MTDPVITPLLWRILTHLRIALPCGGVTGLERQLRGKSVAIRPCVIVVLTTAFVVDLSDTATEDVEHPSCVLPKVVSGFGFLGDGVILAQGVRGITTASPRRRWSGRLRRSASTRGSRRSR